MNEVPSVLPLLQTWAEPEKTNNKKKTAWSIYQTVLHYKIYQGMAQPCCPQQSASKPEEQLKVKAPYLNTLHAIRLPLEYMVASLLRKNITDPETLCLASASELAAQDGFTEDN